MVSIASDARTCFGFDFGTRKIGVALGTALLGQARALGVVTNVQGTPAWGTIEDWYDVGTLCDGRWSTSQYDGSE